jgi:16S rRNA (guanine527-N7)-methyltransferase
MRGIDQPTAASLNVSRETFQRLGIIVDQIRKWQPRINLVAPSTMPDIWQRHVIDSLQLWALVERRDRWIDLGSGGGFPGLVLAALMGESKSQIMVLVESNGKKCAFLRETARLAVLPVEVVNGRIEDVVPSLEGSFDVVSARALASLDQLLALSEPLMARGAVAVFPKGQDVDGEIAKARETWLFSCDLIQSDTEANARVAVIRSASRRV